MIVTKNPQDEFETWMLLEFCDRGSLHRAIERHRISARNGDGKIELVRGLAAFSMTSLSADLHWGCNADATEAPPHA